MENQGKNNLSEGHTGGPFDRCTKKAKKKNAEKKLDLDKKKIQPVIELRKTRNQTTKNLPSTGGTAVGINPNAKKKIPTNHARPLEEPVKTLTCHRVLKGKKGLEKVRKTY